MLQRANEDGGGVLVVVDGVFSMEGDIAPLPRIVELVKQYGARLMVDEAHGAGVLGARGAGASELFGVEADVDLRMGTFSKSLASCGGFIAGPHEVIDFLRISSRAFLFTASGVPAAVGAALAALRIIRSPEGPELFQRVLDNAQYLSAGLRDLGYRVIQGEPAITPGRARAGRGRLEGRAALARPLRRRRLRQRRRSTRPSRPAERCCARASWRPTIGPSWTAPWLHFKTSNRSSNPSTVRCRSRPHSRFTERQHQQKKGCSLRVRRVVER